MKKFWQHAWPILVGATLFVGLFFSIIWLAGFDDWLIFGYGLLIFIVLIMAYLLFTYATERHLWHYLSGHEPFSALKKDSGTLSQTIFSATQKEIAQKNQEIQALRHQQQQYQEFMNLWVHQMKTPVTVIDLLSQEKVIAPLALKAENERLKSGLNLALNLVRTDEFEKDFTLAELSLKTLVKKAIQQQKVTFITRSIFPKINFSDLTVVTDEKWFLFILEQLLTNSLKYSADNSTVDFSTTVTDATIELHLTDHGIGIPEKDLRRVTAPFFTGDNGRKYPEATGMGLYLADKVANELDIRLTMTSMVNVGTTVTLIFKQKK